MHFSSGDADSLSAALGPATGVTLLRRGVVRWKAAGDSSSRDVAVVSESIARAMAPDPRAAVGKSVFAGSRSLRIVGVLPVQGAPSAPALVVRAEQVETVEAVRASVQAWATPRFGNGVTVAATALMRAQTGASIHAAVTLQTVGASLLAAVVTGVVFGVYPALRASRLSPVDAIRTE